MATIRLLSGGAAQGLVSALSPQLLAMGHEVDGMFGAVGAMRAALTEGRPADLVILTATIIGELAAGGSVLRDSVADLGDVETAIAVREGDEPPAVADEEGLRAALLAADAIYFPDPKLATAGIHFAGVLDRLGVADAVRDRLRTFPNGATAMAALARATEKRPIGCTQVTEIKATPGALLVASLPDGFRLKTRYTGAVTTSAGEAEAARMLLQVLTSDASAAARRQAGFV